VTDQSSPVRVATWNLWWRFGPWEQRREAIAAVLADARPDVCGLQEVWAGRGKQLAALLAERLGMHWALDAVPGAPAPAAAPRRPGHADWQRHLEPLAHHRTGLPAPAW
jgi:hypothetical protein